MKPWQILLILYAVVINIGFILYIPILFGKKGNYAEKQFKILKTYINGSIYFLLLITLVYGIYVLVVFGRSITTNRVTNCEMDYNNPSYYVTMGDFPLTYMNPYYEKDMDLTVADFYWAASRKSYAPCGLRYDKVSLTNLQQVLEKGARVIELDVYANEAMPFDSNPELVVRNETIFPEASPLRLVDCFQMIQATAWSRNSKYPLMLQLNLHLGNNEATYRILRENILGFFGSQLLDKKYGYCGRYNLFPLGKIPIKETLGRVGIIMNKYPVHESVDELINATTDDNNDFVQLVKYTSKNTQYGGIVATFTDTNSLINHNKENLMIVENDGDVNIVNMYKPKNDVENLPFMDPYLYGVQWVKMHYNKFDQSMQNYIEFFKQSSLVLKPDELRHIAQPPRPLYEQNVQLSYQSRPLSIPGWYQQNI